MLLLNFVHRQQRHESDCLVACAEMVLNHLGIQLSYLRLAKLLRAGPSFTPFSNLRFLASLHLSITLGEQGDTALFEPYRKQVEVLLRTQADLMRQLHPRILVLGEICLGEHLLLRILEVELPSGHSEVEISGTAIKVRRRSAGNRPINSRQCAA